MKIPRKDGRDNLLFKRMELFLTVITLVFSKFVMVDPILDYLIY